MIKIDHTMIMTYTFRIPTDLKVGMTATFTHVNGSTYCFVVSEKMKKAGKVKVHVKN
jgi:hypothetical protein